MRRYPKKGGQFAIIWVDLLYEDSVPQSAKILFGEIYRLSNSEGWCDASNEDFMDLLGCSENTVRNLLKALADVGQIRIETSPRRDGKGGTIRRIFCDRKLAPPDTQEVPPKNCSTPKYLEGVPPKNCGSTYSKSNKRSKPPIAPQKILDEAAAYASEDKALLDALLGFMEMRAKRRAPFETTRMLRILTGKLDRLSKGRSEVKIKMLDNATEGHWTTVHELKADEMPSASQGTVEEPEGVEFF